MAESIYAPDLEVRSLFSRSWSVFREHLWLTVGVFVIYSLLTSSGGFWDGDNGLGDLVMYLIAGPITAGVYLFALRMTRGGEPDIADVFRGFQQFGRALGVFVLYSVMIVVGLVLLVVPGVFVAIAFMPCMFLVLDDDLGVLDTLRRAWEMTEGYRGRIFIVAVAVVGINVLGLLALLVGVIFTGAWSLLIGATLYDELARAYERDRSEPAL